MKVSLVFIFPTILLPRLVADDDVRSLEIGVSSRSNSTQITTQSEAEAVEASTTSSQVSVTVTGDISITGEYEISEHGSIADIASSMQQAFNHGLADLASQRMMEDESLRQLPSHLKYYFQLNDSPFLWGRETAAPSQEHQYRNHVIIPPYRPFSVPDPPTSPSKECQAEASEKAKYRPNRTGGLPVPECKDDHQAIEASSKDVDESISPKLPAKSNISDSAAAGGATELDAGTNSTMNSNSTDSAAANVATEVGAGTNGTTSVQTSGGSPSSSDQVPVVGIEKDQEQEPKQRSQDDADLVVVDYAGKSGGALIIEKSSGFQGISNLLTTDNDQYAMVPTEAKNKSLIISLSEEILVKTVILSNYERYSSNVKEFQILGSQTMAKWADLGRYTAKPGKFGRQVFELGELAKWARYLKFRFLSHYGDEHYLTITQISVYGTTMQQGFHEHWDEDHSADNEEEKGKDDKVSAQLKAPTNDSVLDISHSVPNVTTKDKETRRNLLIAERGERSQASSAQFSSCSSSKAGGGGNNGYLLFPWVMPLAKVEPISSDSVRVQSSISMFRLTTFLADPTIARTSTFSSRQNRTGPCCSCMFQRVKKEPDMKIILAPPTNSLPRLNFQEMPPALARIFARIEKEKDDLVNGSDAERFLAAHNSSQKREAVGGKGVQVDKEKGREAPLSDKTEPTKSSAASGGGTKVTEKNTVEVQSSAKPKLSVSDGSTEALVNTLDLSVQHSVSKDQGVSVGSRIAEDNQILAILLEQLPSASCLSELDIAQYKAAHSRSSSTGTSSNGPSGGAMEPIFKKLTGEIKSLQASLSVHDKFAKESVACFQRVLLELLVLQELERAEQNMRLEHLENILNGTFLYHVLWGFFSALSSILSTAYFYCMTENLFVRAWEIDWTFIISWMQENMWPSAGIPLSFVCIVLYHNRRNQRSLRKKTV